MVTVPAATPCTEAVILLTVAMAVLLDDQVPPETEPVSAILEPIVTKVEPLIVPADGTPFTVAIAVRMQPAVDV